MNVFLFFFWKKGGGGVVAKIYEVTSSFYFIFSFVFAEEFNLKCIL